MKKQPLLFCTVVFLFTVCFNATLFGQKESYLEQAEKHFRLTEEAFNKGDLKSTISNALKARDYYEKAAAWKDYMTCQNALVTAYYLSGNYTDYQRQLKETLADAEKYLGEQSMGLSAALCNYSVFLREIGNHNEAIKLLKKAMKIEELLETSENSLVTFGNLGTNYFRTGDYGEALKYYFKVETMGLEDNSLLKRNNWANLYNKIGNVYFVKSELDSAKVYFEKSLKILPANASELGDIGRKHKIDAHLYLARVYLKEGLDEALHDHINKAIAASVKNHFNLRGSAYQILGEWYIQKNDLTKATDYFAKSREIAVQKYKAYENHYVIAEKDIQLADAYQKAGEYKLALEYYQNAIRELSQEDPGEDIYSMPKLDNIYSHLNFLQALSGKAETFFELYERGDKLLDLESAYATFDRATQLIKTIRQDYQQEASMLQLSTSVLPVYEGAIKSALALHQQSGKEQYLYQAFAFSESNKAMILLESMHDNTAKGYARIPDSLLAKENNLRLELSFYKRKLYEEQNKSEQQNPDIIRDYKDRIFDLDQACKALVSQFEKEFPEYYLMKFDTDIVSVEDIQKELEASEQSVLIEYFFGEKQIYIFSVTADGIQIEEKARSPDLIQAIQDLRLLINTVPVANVDQAYYRYVNHAVEVYEQLLKPVIPKAAKHLIIIADDVLAYLPIEVLLSKHPQGQEVSYSLGHLDYLLEAYEISYSYSATLLLQKPPVRESEVDGLFLGIAPSFDSPRIMAQRICRDNHLYALKCNIQEVRDIQALQGGTVLLDEQATKTSFEQKANRYRILHLATHACLDDERPEFSKIYFKDDYLTNNDLHNLKLKSELAVLSACDTGSGQLAKGEGVMSLARGFIHAGCPSVVMSLWSVDDCATSEIMLGFYKHLYSGTNKSLSLRQAKLEYLQEAKKANRHPYYWAAFVQIGDTDAIQEFTTSANSYYYWLLLALGILIIWFFLKKR